MLGDEERARAIYEMATEQESIDMPELLWKSYIDFEFEEEQYDNTRALYERLLAKTSHVKVWIAYAQFEANAGRAAVEEMEEEAVSATDAAAVMADAVGKARNVFERGYAELKSRSLKEEVSCGTHFSGI